MLAVAVPGAQRVLVRQARRQRRRILAGGGSSSPSAACVICCVDVSFTSFGGGAGASGASPHLRDAAGSCPTTTTSTTRTTAAATRRLAVRPGPSRSEQQSNLSSPVGFGFGALLAAGGLFLATQSLPASGNPAAMEAEGGGGCHHRPGDHRCHGCAGGAASAAAAPDTDQHSEEASDDINNAPPPAPDGEGGISEDRGGTDGGGGNGEWDDGFPPEGRYRFYILSQDEAAAEASTAVAATDAGRTASSPGGDGSGQLKGRYHFVIIGEGTAADAAVESILRVQPEAEILCLSDETPIPSDGDGYNNNTHTDSYESDFRLLKPDLAASFNQWRRLLAFRVESFSDGGGGGSAGGDKNTGGGIQRQQREWGGRSAYGLSRGKEIRYHTYQPHDLVIEPERRCVRLLLDGTEVFYDKCLIANSGKPRDEALGVTADVTADGGRGSGDSPSATSRSSSSIGSSGSGSGSSSLGGSDAPRAANQGGRRGAQQEEEEGGRGEEEEEEEKERVRRTQDGAGKEEGSAGGSNNFGGCTSTSASRVNRLTCLEDFVSLELVADNPSVKHVTVLGGGFVGCEVALALADRGRATGIVVHQVYSERAPMEHVLPDYLAEYMQRKLACAGVTAVADTALGGLRYDSKTKRLEGGANGNNGGDASLETDYVVVASTHIDPKVDAASDSGFEIDQRNGGIVVNGLFEAVNGVYAAGGAASYFDPALGRRRTGSHDHCVNSGLYAGYNMAATSRAARNDHELAEELSASSSSLSPSLQSPQRIGPYPAPSAPYPRLYDHLPSWRSNLAGCDVVMEGVGELDPTLRTIGVWANNNEDWHSQEAAYKRGVVYYMRDHKVAGVLLLNVSNQLERAREVLRLQHRVERVSQLKRLITLGARGLIRVVDTPASSHLSEL